MMINVQANHYRNRSVGAVGLGASRTQEISRPLKRAMLIAAGVAVFAVLALSQVIAWQVGRIMDHQEILQEKTDSLNSEQINLLARRAKLRSPEHVEALAAVRLGLRVPADSQVHRL